jgi:hypothetical protein
MKGSFVSTIDIRGHPLWCCTSYSPRLTPGEAALFNRVSHKEEELFLGQNGSQSISIKGIAGLGIAGLKSKLEPTHALGRAPVGKSIRDHVTLGPSLDSIIPDLAGSIQCFLDVSCLKDLAALIGLTGPNPCETVGLQFHPHG